MRRFVVLSLLIPILVLAADPPTDQALEQAASILGLELTRAERDSLAPDLAEQLDSFRALRESLADNAIAPALRFDPLWWQPGRTEELAAAAALPDARPVWPVRYDAARPADDHDLAWMSVGELAALLRQGAVTSVELTRLALDRLRTHDDRLHCVITLLEDRALAHASAPTARPRPRPVARPPARHPLRREGPARDPRRPHHLGRHAVPRPGAAGTGDGLRAARRGRRGDHGQAHPGRPGLGRRLVRRHHAQPVEPGAGQQRLLGGLGGGGVGRPGALRHRDRDLGLHRLAQHPLRRDRPAPHLRPRQPSRRHGPELEHGQDRPHRPQRRRTAPWCSTPSLDATATTPP